MNRRDLELLSMKLKQGDYDGADVMQAWVAIEDLLSAARTFAQLRDDAPSVFENGVLIGHCASHDLIGELDACVGKYT